MAKHILKRQFAVECLAESVVSILDDKDASDLTKAEWLAKTFDQFDAHVAKLAPETVPASDDGDTSAEGGDSTLPPKLEQFLAAMLQADPKLRRDEALSYLLHHRGGRQLAEHLSSITKKDEPMSRTEALRTVTKEYGGVLNLCKNIATTGESFVTEAELTKLIDDEAQKTRKAGERPNTAFARFYDAPENIDLRKALQIAKGAQVMDITPVQIGGADVSVDSSRAYDQLVALAEEQLRLAPWLSTSQAFARAFDANPELAAMANQRPAPTTSYPFPR
jgi:hypothetical protein